MKSCHFGLYRTPNFRCKIATICTMQNLACELSNAAGACKNLSYPASLSIRIASAASSSQASKSGIERDSLPGKSVAQIRLTAAMSCGEVATSSALR